MVIKWSSFSFVTTECSIFYCLYRINKGGGTIHLSSIKWMRCIITSAER
jgi:hypothetical protein